MEHLLIIRPPRHLSQFNSNSMKVECSVDLEINPELETRKDCHDSETKIQYSMPILKE